MNKKMMLKAEKHEIVKMLVDAKLNTINDHSSNLLKDEKISDRVYAYTERESKV